MAIETAQRTRAGGPGCPRSSAPAPALRDTRPPSSGVAADKERLRPRNARKSARSCRYAASVCGEAPCSVCSVARYVGIGSGRGSWWRLRAPLHGRRTGGPRNIDPDGKGTRIKHASASASQVKQAPAARGRPGDAPWRARTRGLRPDRSRRATRLRRVAAERSATSRGRRQQNAPRRQRPPRCARGSSEPSQVEAAEARAGAPNPRQRAKLTHAPSRRGQGEPPCCSGPISVTAAITLTTPRGARSFTATPGPERLKRPGPRGARPRRRRDPRVPDQRLAPFASVSAAVNSPALEEDADDWRPQQPRDRRWPARPRRKDKRARRSRWCRARWWSPGGGPRHRGQRGRGQRDAEDPQRKLHDPVRVVEVRDAAPPAAARRARVHEPPSPDRGEANTAGSNQPRDPVKPGMARSRTTARKSRPARRRLAPGPGAGPPRRRARRWRRGRGFGGSTRRARAARS